MKKILKILIIALMAVATGCNNQPTNGTNTVKVKAVEQVENYTYLLVKGKGPAYWIAVNSTEIEAGESISYQGGMLMENFYSEELDRTFDKVLFLDGIEGNESPSQMGMMPGTTQGSAVKTDRLELSLDPEEGVVSIAELYANPGAYEGKTIRVKGKVARFNPNIMERNWIHIQDGSDFEGKYDLTVTSQEVFEVGQVLTLEGILALNRDFGYGYSYEIILEKATADR
ncbi:MAG: hypothetical protein P1P86_09275 [Bacteroidales bacterium]|nr:hypothetical protein [Bacteroidales bacterium]